MQLTQAFEDRAVRQLLIGGESDQAEGFAQVDAHLRNRFVYGARGRLPGLRSEDLADAWQETLEALLKAVRAREFDPERELVPWLWTVFIRRALDGVRRKHAYQGMLARAREQLGGAETQDLLGLIDEEERARVVALVQEAVSALPERQRIVHQVFLDHHPMTEDDEVLRQLVSDAAGRHVTRGAIRRALQEGRRKIGSLLRSRQD